MVVLRDKHREMDNVLFKVVVRDKKTGEVIDTIGEKGMTSSQSLRVLGGVRINLDRKRYEATTEVVKG